jgi:hypothetical protein
MLVGLGRSLLGEGRPDEAQEVLRDALRMSLEVLDEDHMEVRIAQAALGECLLVGGRPGEAEPLLKASLESLRRQPGPKASREAERITTLLAGG